MPAHYLPKPNDYLVASPSHCSNQGSGRLPILPVPLPKNSAAGKGSFQSSSWLLLPGKHVWDARSKWYSCAYHHVWKLHKCLFCIGNMSVSVSDQRCQFRTLVWQLHRINHTKLQQWFPSSNDDISVLWFYELWKLVSLLMLTNEPVFLTSTS